MEETPESDKEVNSQLRPRKLPSPKRGAIPTPRAEIENATPYIPETDQEGNTLSTERVSPRNVGNHEETVKKG